MKTRLSILFAIVLLPLCGARADDYRNETLSNTPILVAAAGTSGVQLLGWPSLINGHATQPVFLHFYDAATAGAVTVGTTADVFVLGVAAGPGDKTFPTNGVTQHLFTNGMVVAVTTSWLSNVATAPSTALKVHLQYVNR